MEFSLIRHELRYFLNNNIQITYSILKGGVRMKKQDKQKQQAAQPKQQNNVPTDKKLDGPNQPAT